MTKKIAILGNGQLAAMLKEESKDLAIKVDSFDLPEINLDGNSSDQEISAYCSKLEGYDVVSYEIENISVDLLRALAKSAQVFPSINALEVAQDRLKEKYLFTKLDVKTNRYLSVNSKDELRKAADTFGLPFIVKTRRFGYDGKGQYVIKKTEDIDQAWRELGQYDLIAESFVDFEFEVSQVATQDQFGNVAFYPLVKNTHVDGILRESVLLEDSCLQEMAKAHIHKLLKHFDYVGTLAIEFFVKDNMLYANEMAPRVHNSGHFTLDASYTSQFKNHMLAISGEKVADPSLKYSYTLMVNLIGEDVPKGLLKSDTIRPKSYQKSLRAGRKMGHINIVAHDEPALNQAKKLIYQYIEAKPVDCQRAYFAGGCFWGVEYYFSCQEGVISAKSGYMGGALEHPDYQRVKKGDTGHLEVVEVSFDPKMVSYETLVKLFFEIHDPTQKNGQGVDIGTQYLSAIFYVDEEQKECALLLMKTLEEKGYHLATKLIDAKCYPFWCAEQFHQNYFNKLHEAPTCHIRTKRF
ncbi:5-(carboxyamino)imidazole ribonucleotide synthase [Fangia hongkongensis]|uniref:5-(carboxyamino)imidazole ribonucleotide synthase n=1 Tax=Fangia hongkongensis TaxID=270495 RepID=UPI000375C426|nr:5-(carboxyamino)imidazole ribonucleotide synthase [Fangia hongkongensis]MBK2123717.1 5-(carboxyamino)imidazole ribonucleotide synthase [Fangia hongkongensis]